MSKALHVTIYMASGRKHTFVTNDFNMLVTNDELGRPMITEVNVRNFRDFTATIFVQHIEEVEVVNDLLGSVVTPQKENFIIGFEKKRTVTRWTYSV